MSLFHARSKRADAHLEWKVRLFSVAAVAGLCGIYFDERWMGGLAIALLAAAMLLRFIPGERGDQDDEDPEPDPSDVEQEAPSRDP